MYTVPHVHDVYAMKSSQMISHVEDGGVSNISDVVSPSSSSGIDTMMNAAPYCIYMQGMPLGANKMPRAYYGYTLNIWPCHSDQFLMIGSSLGK